LKEVEVSKILRVVYELPDHVPTRNYSDMVKYCDGRGMPPGDYRINTKVIDSRIVMVKRTNCHKCLGDVTCNECNRLMDEINT